MRIVRCARSAALLLALLAPPHRLAAQQCPAIDFTQGYPLTISWAAGSGPDSAWMAAFGRAAAFRWQAPTRRREDAAASRRVQGRTLPPEPRWADDSSPSALHRADMAITMHADGRLRAGQPGPASGDPFFGCTLATIVTDPAPGAPRMPDWPYDMASDAVVLLLSFGLEDVAGPHAVTRFAAQQSPVRVVPGTMRLTAPRRSPPSGTNHRAVVKYDVADSGTVAAGSIEIIESSPWAVPLATPCAPRASNRRNPTAGRSA